MWSFVPRNLFNMSSPFSDAYKLESFETKILLKLDGGINGTAVAEQIRGLDLEIYGVESFDEQWQQSQQMNNMYTYSSLQIADTQRLGLIFVVLAASVGTVLISVVSLSERSREATLMSVRGLSYRQLVWMFLTENLAVITFSVILGLSVGLIIVYGNITSSNAVISALVQKRLVFSTDFIVSIASYIAIIYASTIGSILVMSRQYVTKLERMIRLR
jgi:ABC-type antimicrobial peptide transport system permease subunit